MSGKKGMGHYPSEMKVEAVRLFYEEGKWLYSIRLQISTLVKFQMNLT